MTVYSQISQNKLKTNAIVFFFFVFVSFLAYVLGHSLGYSGPSLFIFAFLLSFLSSFFSYFWSDKIVLKLHKAIPADRQIHYDFYTVTENLSLAAGIPKPKAYVIEDSAPNAFATGRDYKHAIVVVTTGLLQKMDRRELEGVVAHELSHIKNYDMLLMTIVSVMVGLVVYLTDFFMRSLWFRGGDRDNRNNSGLFLVLSIVLSLLAPLVATLLQLAISRKREFLADASAAYLTRYPDGLARALEKLQNDPQPLKSASNATAHLFIASPLKADCKAKKSWLINLFSTHPPLADRIAKLRQM
jgi:heat shock protein HtpX